MQNVLVTGASGFIGSHIVRALRARHISVRCLVRRSSRLDYLRPSAAEVVWGDLNEPTSLAAALAGVEAVVHCAGVTKARSRAAYYRANAEGCTNLYSACREHGDTLSRVVHISSLAALGPSPDGNPIVEENLPSPVSDHGESKLAGQRIAERWMNDLPISIIIPPAVYGPQDKDFLVYFKFIKYGFVPLIAGPPRLLSLIYVKDFAEAAVQVLLSASASGRSYLVSDGDIYSWIKLADTIASIMKRRPSHIRLPLAGTRILGILGDTAGRFTGRATVLSSQRIREFVQTNWTCSSQKINEELHFHPQYSLDSGIAETYQWYKENRWL
jgi:nucleoside-diphosphate-sugar epimerase